MLQQPLVRLRTLQHVSSTLIIKRTFFDLISHSKPKIQTYRIKKILPFDSKLLHAVVSDVGSYHKFLPYCQNSIVSCTDSNNKPTRAGLMVGYKGFNEQFESIVQCDSNTVAAECIDTQLFDTLKTKWKFYDIKGKSNKTRVEFELEFAFNNSLYNTVSKSFGPTLAEIMVKAFQDRAAELENRGR